MWGPLNSCRSCRKKDKPEKKLQPSAKVHTNPIRKSGKK